MNLLSISINHRSAPVELREALHLSNDEITNLIKQIKGSLLAEGLVISTCNRTEIYGIPVNPELSHTDLQQYIINQKSVTDVKPEHFQNYNAKSAVSHLFRLAAGIDSMLIGDNQIYKQVKDSFQLAEDAEFSGFLMKRLFDHAAKVGKRAITETAISEGAVTVSFAAVQLIEKIFANLSKKSALVIGTGETGEIAAKHLRSRGVGRLALTNRTFEKAERLAEELKTAVFPFNNFKEHLHKFDIVVSATSSEGIILTRTDIASAMKKRNNAEMVLMDIAVPRDIDPASTHIDYVFYHDIDSLNIIVEQNLNKRREEIPKVERIVEEEIEAFFNWYNSLQAAPTIKSLRNHFESIRREEVEKNKNRFSKEEQEKLDIITKRIVNKLLHQPSVELKKFNDSSESRDESAMKISIIREIFGLQHNSNEEKKNE